MRYWAGLVHHLRHGRGDRDQDPVHGRLRRVLIVAISIGFGMIPIVSPNFFRIVPVELKPIFGMPSS